MYLAGIESGAYLAPDDPRMLLRTRYLLRKSARNAGMVADDWQYIVTALNAHLAGEPSVKLSGRAEFTWVRVGESREEYGRRQRAASEQRARSDARHEARKAQWRAGKASSRATLAADAAVVSEIVHQTGATLPEAMAASGRTA
jgi:hypothetical protein